MNITDPIRRQAALDPDAIAAVRPDGNEVTYRALDRTIDSVARRAMDAGVRPGQIVGVAVPGHYRHVVLMLALARLGAAGAPMTFPAERMDLCIAGAGAAPDLPGRMVALDALLRPDRKAPADLHLLPSHRDGAAICAIFSSSGTTGVRKHIAFSHDLLAKRVLWKFLAVNPPERARQISTIGPGTSYGFHSILRVLWTGGTIILPGRPITIEKYVESIERHQVDFLLTSPSTLADFIASMPAAMGPFPSLKIVEVSGSALPARLGDKAQKRLCPNIVALYGATEASSIASAPWKALRGHAYAAGHVHPGVEVQAIDDNGAPVAPGTQGMLRVKSPLCVAEYVDDPATSLEVFKGGWFHPGDIGSVSRDGLLTVTGRTSDLINRGGVKVSPHVIEEALAALPEIGEVAAFGAPGPMGVTQIWAAIVSDVPMNLPDIEAFSRERLGDKAPIRFLQLPKLPRNETGKILRSELTALAIASLDTTAPTP